MKRYQVELTGITPLLMHCDNIKWRDDLAKWLKDPLNKKLSKAGDDRTPAWTWLGYAYHDGKTLGIPSDNLMSCIRDGATGVTISGKKTFKSQSQSGIIVNEILWPLEIEGAEIPWAPFENLIDNNEFSEHEEEAKKHGFGLFVKPSKIGQSKHVRVRPRFEKWSAAGTITVFDEMITKEVLENIFMFAGLYCGLCDWRPKSPKSPGQFGKFNTKIKEIK